MLSYPNFVSWLTGVLDMNEDGLNADQIKAIRTKMLEVRFDLGNHPKIQAGINPPGMRC